ncbi:hypothetical protein I4I73_04335 [Pseudonocardia sp. KRD-184]|uniref:Uncharacterized protein n=1 Tax=Pseudonocardia oceani TaxID=2792013 RepID=A0ABS6UAB1_9PSEU|nr:hypothetical protein [Pseudonocardia oceani]MBW0089745.1 hypothetical protein [Pseudonocardia oceani]MBW0095227.1 hypothetical protein [Pseudonocardia oceani]MBW0107725.1 hypothetical protein [Pseudonocardia oceani]MBW0121722.1 hypothetical protein [Pseudonocardia oceani]MBW0129187.1 hypothetical protein [Pseudonocardia oceani]
MELPEEIRHALSRWCAERIPEREREHRRIGYTVHGGEVTISDRRAPVRPELDVEWSTTPLARLRVDDTGHWTLYRPVDGGWARTSDGADPIALLEAQAPA